MAMISSSTSWEDAPSEPLLSEIAEETLDHVEPRTAGRGEVHVKARMAGQPLLHFGVLVRGVVIGDQVQVFVGRRQIVDYA